MLWPRVDSSLTPKGEWEPIAHLHATDLASSAKLLHEADQPAMDNMPSPAAVRRKSPAQRSTGQDPRRLRRLLRAKDRMDAASEQAWTIQRLAKVSRISEAHFARSFKEAFGLPPHRYLLTRRIERATVLLRDGDLPILEIALQTGWSSLGTFGRTFRDITGESPGEFRAHPHQDAVAPSLELVPACFLSAASRPDLRTAVSEKRRQSGVDTMAAADKEPP